MRLLVAEDERDLNRLLQKVLTKAGYTVDGCYDGEEALLYLQGTAYDALVLDVMMRRKDGGARGWTLPSSSSPPGTVWPTG